MGNPVRVWWIVVECACRILGISTATVLCAVGVDSLHQGKFLSLAIYLLVSSLGIMLFELAYFLDALLSMCLPCPADCWLFVLWGKMARIGGFQKFLYYTIMSLVCFLHPVLVWHAVIPGTMLLVTALFNFILSKKGQAESPEGPHENHSDQGLTAGSVMDRGGPGTSFLSFLPLGKGTARAALSAALLKRDGERSGWRELRQVCFSDRRDPVEREMEEMELCSEPETTSDTDPMITN